MRPLREDGDDMGRLKKIIKKIIRSCMYTVKEPVYVPLLKGSFLEGRTVLITGGSGGIGSAIAKTCVDNGADVIICGRNPAKLETMKDEILQHKSTACIYSYRLDITAVDSFAVQLEEMAQLVPNKRIDVLINKAGLDAGGMIPETIEKQYDQTVETNLKGTYFLTQAFANYLLSHGIRGNILNVSSASGNRPVVTPCMYSKWAITGLTKGLAKRLIGRGIVVNGIAPGPTATQMLGLDGSNLHHPGSPAKRYADPNEIANLAVFLVSDMGRMIVGETIYITGGVGTLSFDDIDYEL